MTAKLLNLLDLYEQSMIKRKHKTCRCPLYIFILYIMVFSGFSSFRLFRNDVTESKNPKTEILIPTGSSYDDAVEILVDNKIVKRQKFNQYAGLYGYDKVKGGRYIVEKGTSYRKLVKMLNAGNQTPVNMVISGNIRTKDKLAGIISKQIEADSAVISDLLNDENLLAELGFNSENAILLFIPDTYNVYWNRNPRQLFRDMKKRYDNFWNESRLKKLEALELTKEEVMITASIVAEESSKNDELKRIAGVYINRLNRGMLLQADPTVKYAVGDFGLKRILIKHTQFDSPYNTYIYKGLPPGPICIPSIAAVDAVLNREHHDYLYFCAKDDYSGYHVFAKTLQQHNQNANAYRSALNKNKIFR